MTTSPQNPPHVRRPRASLRAYALLFVLVLGVVLASLTAMLLFATGRDDAEARVQLHTVHALYAAEGAVAAGVREARDALATSTTPDLCAIVPPALPGVSYPAYRVGYYDAVAQTVSCSTPTTTTGPIGSGPNVGLVATQTPLQVLATAEVNHAHTTVADALRIDSIPLFQFTLFSDSDLEMDAPAATRLEGRVHSNGDVYLSNLAGQLVSFGGVVTSAGLVHNRSSYAASVKVAANQTTFFNGSTQVALRASPALPEATDAAQAQYLTTTFGTNHVVDHSLEQDVLLLSLHPSDERACAVDADCDTAELCHVVHPGDATGACRSVVASRPLACGDGSSTATRGAFAQSPAIELIRRPALLYSRTGLYDTGGAPSSIYTADFGPAPTDVHGDTLADAPDGRVDVDESTVLRSIPVMNTMPIDDDSGVADERLYWRADIRIIDGIWYKKGSNVPVFDPETWDLGAASFTPSTITAFARVALGHKFARVLRYSWWWDPRENRVYPGASSPNQRGLQIRATDFDVAAFNALLDDSEARALLFSDGAVPASGLTVFLSETTDPTTEDANTQLDDDGMRGANVRNFLDFAVMENHLPGDFPITPVVANKGASPAPSPTARGYYPSNLWGKNAPLPFRSLTPAQDTSGNTIAPTLADLLTTTTRNALRTFYGDNRVMAQSLAALGAGFDCQEPVFLTSTTMPGSRSLATPLVKPSCIQSGATPLGAENAVRIVRAQTIRPEGLTIVTDNRAYVQGDVNAISSGGTNATVARGTGGTERTQQDLSGRVAIIADSLTLLSARHSDRFLQRGGAVDGSERFNRRARFTSVDAGIAPVPALVPWTIQAPDEDGGGAGAAPNLCTLARTLDTTPVGDANVTAVLPAGFAASRNLRKALPTVVNASLIVGDVPPCIDGDNLVGNPSGGALGLVRVVENWQGVVQVVHGSVVSLFRSERGNARWLPLTMGDTFASSSADVAINWRAVRRDEAYDAWSGSQTPCAGSAPVRAWGPDLALRTTTALPPSTPRVVASDRLRWIRR